MLNRSLLKANIVLWPQQMDSQRGVLSSVAVQSNLRSMLAHQQAPQILVSLVSACAQSTNCLVLGLLTIRPIFATHEQDATQCAA